MQVFKDANGKEWIVSVTIGSALRVRELCGIELLKLDDALFEQLGDPFKLVSTIYALCKPQADASGTTPEQFAEGLCGDSLEAATDALMGAVADFFPSRKKKVFQKLAETVKEVETLQIQKAEALLEGPEMAEKMAEQIESLRTPGKPSAKSSEPSESTPDLTTSAN